MVDENVNTETGEIEEFEWDSVGPSVWKFEQPGAMLIARYVGRDVQELDGELTTRHDVRSIKGDDPMFFWGSTVLDNLMKHVGPGDVFRLIFTGESEKVYKGGNRAKLFSLEKAR